MSIQPSPRRSRRLRLLGSVSARTPTQPSPRRSRRLRLLGSVSARTPTQPSPRRSRRLRLLGSVSARTPTQPSPQGFALQLELPRLRLARTSFFAELAREEAADVGVGGGAHLGRGADVR